MERKRVVHVIFDVGLVAKGIDGALEVLGGVLLGLVNPSRINHAVRILTQHELSEDPHDPVAHALLHSAQQLTGSTKAFAATYLLWHGVVKTVLVTALLLKYRWAYPAAILAFFLFLIYQLYRYTHTHAPALLALSALDALIIVLTYLEYLRLRTSRPFR